MGIVVRFAINDFAILVDDECRPFRHPLESQQVFIENIVCSCYFFVEVAKQWKTQIIGFRECVLGKRAIDTDAENLGV